MRIISGSFRGKKILQPLDNFTRPLKDLTKESIFNVIKHSNKFNIDKNKIQEIIWHSSSNINFRKSVNIYKNWDIIKYEYDKLARKYIWSVMN